MALTKEIYTDFRITSWDKLEVRQRRVFFDDGEEVKGEARRAVLNPGDDVSQFPLRIQRVAAVLWTAECIAYYQAVEVYLTARDAYAMDPTPENEQARDDARTAAIQARNAYQTETGENVPRPPTD